MTINTNEYNKFLEDVAKSLDISPSKYKLAVERYESVGTWLQNGDYPDFIGAINIYPQGSFRLGTVVRPIREQIEKDYDIDLVCEFVENPGKTTAKEVKHRVGNRLTENDTYKAMLDDEGRRCWTLIYAEQDDTGFHLDVLPSSGNSGAGFSPIEITHKHDDGYNWMSSNPRGYAVWFEEVNSTSYRIVASAQKQLISNSFHDVYAKVDDVPDQLVRTSLQRVIQIMKRHRDMRFNGNGKHAPISMIITTLAAHLYNNESDVLTTLRNIVLKLEQHSNLLQQGYMTNRELSMQGVIKRQSDGTWYIGNPTNPEENFADKWHEDNHARATAFFQWVSWLKEDFLSYERRDFKNIQSIMRLCLGASIANRCWAKNITIPAAKPEPREVNIGRGVQPWRNCD